MNTDIIVQPGVIIPFYELDIATSRAGGAGGQHVNKTDSRVTVRWNVHNTLALTDLQRSRVLSFLQHKLTADGDLIVHNSESRSQGQNKENALRQLVEIVRRALFIPKKRVATAVSKSAKRARLKEKKRQGEVKRLRSKKFDDD